MEPGPKNSDKLLPLRVMPMLALRDAGLLMLMLTCPQSSVCTSSVNAPRWSTFIFIAYLNFSGDDNRYDVHDAKLSSSATAHDSSFMSCPQTALMSCR